MTPEDGNFIIYTSGTTGKPKAALLTSKSILSMCRSLGKAMAVKPSDRMLNALPLNHVGGATILSINSLMHGSTLILQDSFHPETYAGAIQDEKVTLAGGVRTIWTRPRMKTDGCTQGMWRWRTARATFQLWAG
ncbi:MAG: AMP-binding protein [Bacillota bacterium]